MPLALLRIPVLASMIIIKQLEIEHLIPLIKMSRRTRNLVKLCKISIEVTFYPLSCSVKRLNPLGKWIEVKFDNCDPSLQYPGVEGFKKLINDFVNIFIFKSASFHLDGACSFTALCFLEEAKSLQLEFSSLTVPIGDYDETLYHKLLRICSSTSRLALLVRTELPFEFNGFHEYRIPNLYVVIRSCNLDWFTIDIMCALVNCTYVRVSGVAWGSDHLNKFLKFWMSRDDCRLETMVLLLEHRFDICPQRVMNEIDKREIVRNEKYEIRKVNGERAIVVFELHKISLVVMNS